MGGASNRKMRLELLVIFIAVLRPQRTCETAKYHDGRQGIVLTKSKT